MFTLMRCIFYGEAAGLKFPLVRLLNSTGPNQILIFSSDHQIHKNTIM